MQEQVEKENAYSHSLSYQHWCENNNNRRQASLQQVADPLQRARNREKKWRRRCSSSSQWEATCLPPSLSLHPPSRSALLVHCPCVSRILTIYSYVATLARIIHGKFTKSRRKNKWNCGQSNLCILNTKFPKWLISSVLPPPFLSHLSLSLIIVFGNQHV